MRWIDAAEHGNMLWWKLWRKDPPSQSCHSANSSDTPAGRGHLLQHGAWHLEEAQQQEGTRYHRNALVLQLLATTLTSWNCTDSLSCCHLEFSTNDVIQVSEWNWLNSWKRHALIYILKNWAENCNQWCPEQSRCTPGTALTNQWHGAQVHVKKDETFPKHI